MGDGDAEGARTNRSHFMTRDDPVKQVASGTEALVEVPPCSTRGVGLDCCVRDSPAGQVRQGNSDLRSTEVETQDDRRFHVLRCPFVSPPDRN